MIIQGKRPDGSAIFLPMVYGFMVRMMAQDLDAVVLYLQSLPALPNAG